MKKARYLSIAAFAFCVNTLVAFAAPSHSISVSSGTIESGQNVTATVTVKNAAAWNVKINGTGNTNGCSTSSADATSNGKNATKNFSVTCKSNSTGIIKITYSGDATSEDGSTTNLSGSRTVTVVAPRPRSTNNNLKSLEVEGATLSPEFNVDTLEYTTTLEAGTEKAVIKAEKSDNTASVSGDGEVTLVEGENRFEIKVTSESGSTKTYVVIINVKEYDPIIVNVDGKSYTVVRKLEELTKPDSFTESTVQMGEDVIPAFYNEQLNKTLVGLRDEDGKIYLFVYKDGEYERYIEIPFNKVTLNLLKMNKKLLPKGYKEYTIKLGEEKVTGYKLNKSSRYALVYGEDVSTGDKNLYQVDLDENTVQIYNDEYIEKINKENKRNLILISSTLAFIAFLEFIVIRIKSSKNKKITKTIKDQKIKKIKKAAIKDAEKESINEENME